MPIPLTCGCGRSLRIKDEFAGCRVKCPGCREVLAVPLPEVEEEEAAEVLLAQAPDDEPRRSAIRAEPPPEPAPRRDEDDEPPRRRRPRRDEPRDVVRDVRKRAPAIAFEEGWFGSINSGVVGGLLMMVIAVVWFVIGLAGGIIFFYPPILLVIGLVALVKGLAGGGD